MPIFDNSENYLLASVLGPSLRKKITDALVLTQKNAVDIASISTPASGNAVADGDKGDVVVSAGGTVWTVEGKATAAQGVLASTALQPGDDIPSSDVIGLDAALANKQPLSTVLTNTTASFTTANETKLGGIATGATVNSPDATLLSRSNHTGSQLASTISDFNTAVAAIPETVANTAKVTNATHTGDATGSTALTLATVNANVGSFGLAGAVAQFAVNAKGLITSAANVAISLASTAISDSTAAGRAFLTAATAAVQTELLNPFTSALKGLVPASGGGTTSFLRADGTWSPLTTNRAYGQLAANYTLTSAVTVQKLFNWSTNGAVTLATGRYQFRTVVYITGMSATSGNAAFSLAGTATLADRIINVIGIDSTTPLSAAAIAGSASVTSATVASMVTAGVGTGMLVEIAGMFNVTVTGTVIPSIQLVTAAAAVVQAGSYFECVRIADTGTTTLGTWT